MMNIVKNKLQNSIVLAAYTLLAFSMRYRFNAEFTLNAGFLRTGRLFSD